MNKKISTLGSIALIFALLVSAVYGVIFPRYALAASVTSFSDVLTREKASIAANHLITFTVPANIASGETVILTFNNSTSIPGAFDFTDVDVTDDGVDLPMAATPSGATWGVANTSSTVITLTNGTTAVASGSVVTIELGTNATFGTTGTHQITNGPAGTTTLVLSGTMGIPDMTGTASMSIIDDDQVSITASVNQAITFDLDTKTDFSNGESGAPYLVALGTLSTSSVTHSDTSSVAMIVAEGDTNAAGGMNVTVSNTNGTNGLVSTSVPGDNINSGSATMSAGTENYGLCVATSGLTGFTRATGYVSDTCALASGTNGVQALSTTPANILTSAAPIANAHAEIVVNAAISTTTVAHTDYTDTLTFIATGTF